jgi:hypothetical protein
VRTLTIKAVVMTEGDRYIIHGSDAETPAEMFKTMTPLWTFDPAKEEIHYVEFELELRETEKEFTEITHLDPFAG